MYPFVRREEDKLLSQHQMWDFALEFSKILKPLKVGSKLKIDGLVPPADDEDPDYRCFWADKQRQGSKDSVLSVQSATQPRVQIRDIDAIIEVCRRAVNEDLGEEETRQELMRHFGVQPPQLMLHPPPPPPPHAQPTHDGHDTGASSSYSQQPVVPQAPAPPPQHLQLPVVPQAPPAARDVRDTWANPPADLMVLRPNGTVEAPQPDWNDEHGWDMAYSWDEAYDCWLYTDHEGERFYQAADGSWKPDERKFQ